MTWAFASTCACRDTNFSILLADADLRSAPLRRVPTPGRAPEFDAAAADGCTALPEGLMQHGVDEVFIAEVIDPVRVARCEREPIVAESAIR